MQNILQNKNAESALQFIQTTLELNFICNSSKMGYIVTFASINNMGKCNYLNKTIL